MKSGIYKHNYDILMQQQINGLKNKPKILLHSCCGPCSSTCIERLKPYFDVTVFYYNPNIYPKEEFIKRLETQNKVLSYFDVDLKYLEYNEEEYLSKVQGLELEKEGGERCKKCFYLRLKKTAEFAKQNGYDYFGTTLTVSSHKDEQIINKIGEEISNQLNIPFLYSDFKKHDGYKRSIELSKQLNLYRQNYCGCRFSLRRDFEIR